MRVLISGGGTGGHIYPALAVAKQLQKTYEADILYLGSDDGLETEVIPAAGLRFAAIKAGKLRRFVSWSTLSGVARVPLGIVQAQQIVRQFHPDVAFTSGGYVAVPAGLAARLSGAPLLMHQQDVPPNLSNRLLAPLATRISVAFAGSMHYFPAKKTIHLGNPIRQAILDIRQTAPEQARVSLGFAVDVPLLLVTGGSQGARHLNTVVCQALPELLASCQVLQISGAKLYEETRTLAAETMAGLDDALRSRYRLVAYMSDEMPLALQAAALVLCRAGASTISELAVLGKPGILVPLPPGIGSSPQEANAALFGRAQAAQVILDADLQRDTLVSNVTLALASEQKLQHMGEAARGFAMPAAAEQIVETIVSIARGNAAVAPKDEVLSI